jgi:hypothetical protein
MDDCCSEAVPKIGTKRCRIGLKCSAYHLAEAFARFL